MLRYLDVCLCGYRGLLAAEWDDLPGSNLTNLTCWTVSLPAKDSPLPETGKKHQEYRHWDRIRIGRSQKDITDSGFNAIRFDPRKPAHAIRRMDSNLGMGGAVHWNEKRRFSLPEFKRFGSFPDSFLFAGEFQDGIQQIGNCVPPLFMRAIAENICQKALKCPTQGLI